jgi:hypothetical protein
MRTHTHTHTGLAGMRNPLYKRAAPVAADLQRYDSYYDTPKEYLARPWESGLRTLLTDLGIVSSIGTSLENRYTRRQLARMPVRLPGEQESKYIYRDSFQPDEQAFIENRLQRGALGAQYGKEDQAYGLAGLASPLKTGLLVGIPYGAATAITAPNLGPYSAAVGLVGGIGMTGLVSAIQNIKNKKIIERARRLPPMPLPITRKEQRRLDKENKKALKTKAEKAASAGAKYLPAETLPPDVQADVDRSRRRTFTTIFPKDTTSLASMNMASPWRRGLLFGTGAGLGYTMLNGTDIVGGLIAGGIVGALSAAIQSNRNKETMYMLRRMYPQGVA